MAVELRKLFALTNNHSMKSLDLEYGRLVMQTSKAVSRKGAAKASPTIKDMFGKLDKSLLDLSTNRVLISQLITLFALGAMYFVTIPKPVPISKTVSVLRRPASSTRFLAIDSEISMCWPSSLRRLFGNRGETKSSSFYIFRHLPETQIPNVLRKCLFGNPLKALPLSSSQ